MATCPVRKYPGFFLRNRTGTPCERSEPSAHVSQNHASGERPYFKKRNRTGTPCERSEPSAHVSKIDEVYNFLNTLMY